jgi:hypothetical protein
MLYHFPHAFNIHKGNVFFSTMYTHRHTLLVLINITIQSWYTYKQHNTKRIHLVILPQPIIVATIKHKKYCNDPNDCFSVKGYVAKI